MTKSPIATSTAVHNPPPENGSVFRPITLKSLAAWKGNVRTTAPDKRLNLSRRYTETYSATSAARILGMDSKTVSVYCLQGVIKSGRRKTKRLTQQGGDWHSIERSDLRRFVIDNLGMIDFRRVDKFAMVDLLVTESPTP